MEKPNNYYTNQFAIRCKTVQEFSYQEVVNYPMRVKQEDCHIEHDADFDNQYKQDIGLFAVLDGHGGEYVGKYCHTAIYELFKKHFNPDQDNNDEKIKNLFWTIFKEIDEELKKKTEALECGACCCIALLVSEGEQQKLYLINIGDTRAVVIKENEVGIFTNDHKASNLEEQKRVQQCGGQIMNNRVLGQLAVTRAIGDIELKSYGVTNEPEVTSCYINKDTQYLVIASDGLWDICNNKQTLDIIKNVTKDPKATTLQITQGLIKSAIQGGSRDNTSVFVIKFKQKKPEPEKKQ